tara:strand:+ start:7762 stop:8403 length:642 start_codon:yes stop_codon:yes gene_type:complete
MLDNKKILMVIAHADDEIIVGWPIFQNPNIEKYILLVSTDENNNERLWCNKRKYIFQDICNKYNIKFKTINNPSEFYRTKTRGISYPLSKIYQNIIDNIHDIKKEFNFDYIFTHNPHGEYGHLDHITCFNIIHNFTNYPILITDIWLKTPTWPISKLNDRVIKNYYSNNVLSECTLNLNLHYDCKNMYEHNKYGQNCWTWSDEPLQKCSLYLI